MPLARIDLGPDLGAKARTPDEPAPLTARVYYLHNNINGAPEEMTDARGTLVWQARYAVWGNTVAEHWHREHRPDPSGLSAHPLPQNLRMQGQYADQETGLCYNTFRYYDPDIGRFISQDPIGLAGGMNLYQYAPNPISWIDPWGWSIVNTGGRFADLDSLKQQGEVGHHMAQNAYNRTIDISRADGPAIGMTTADHESTRTYKGRGNGTMNRDGAAGLNARERMFLDIQDIRSKFGGKYRKGTLEAIKYAKSLPEYQKKRPRGKSC